MEPRYRSGQPVTVRSVKGQDYQLKYPEIEQYVGENGTIIESYCMGTSQSRIQQAGVENISGDCFYRVQLGVQNKLVTIPEDALEPLFSDD